MSTSKYIDFIYSGMVILREEIESHLAEVCREESVSCSNQGCDKKIKRKESKAHTLSECRYRIVECTFKKYGCKTKDIKANELENHLKEYQMQHISDKFEYITDQVRYTDMFLYHTSISALI